MCVHVHAPVPVQARGHDRCLPQSLSALFFETGSPTKPGAHRLGETSWPESASDHLTLPPQHKIIGVCYHTQLLTWVLRICTQGLTVMVQAR